MNCIHLTVVFLSLSACHQEGRPQRLPGFWVGTLEVGGDLRFVRAEFAPARSGMTGSLHLVGAGDMTLVRASESDGSVGFEMRRGDDEFIFVGAFRADAIVGRVHHAGKQVPFELHRTLEVDRRLLAAYAGTYKRPSGELRSIEDCTGELGWQQLIYVDRSGGRKALFARSENSFYFGPEYLIPEPIEGAVTFLGGADGRASHLLVEQTGVEPEIARRSDSGAVQPRNPRGCRPMRESTSSLKAGRSG
jgi:hypothetical protein